MVGVAVAGNQTIVAVGVSVSVAAGSGVGVSAGPAQPARINPQATSSNSFLPHFSFLKWERNLRRGRWGLKIGDLPPKGAKEFVGMVSFIVSKTGRIFA